MSSIRLFILSSFAELGPMHGHRLRIEAEAKHVHLWTDISVGAVYGAMKRLALEGLLCESGREREGNRPTRQLYEITEEGRLALVAERGAGLSEVWFKYDPFDLALTRIDPDTLDTLPVVLAQRLDNAQALLAQSRRVNENAREHVGLAKQWALRHTEYRLGAEVAFLSDLLSAATDIVSDERNPQPRKPPRVKDLRE
ncbi:transcriptional regulator, PadR family [Abditibacterium utsteinense]|uniref:Transcriptional regulator, PadR family n=1 Tax=Abditibacterium utsteinense TaxID=1960156 RepID=A0A2S8SPF6_9BACT|nr:PadR family transcriptional regulator [Abditibacterium utsteinense]PQV62682.1 transcriptional regulator, PadR family [Abditibacterium utsteinense]